MPQFEATHGLSESPTFHSWENMIQRCTNPRNPLYRYYGARGITVCERWLTFSHFLADMGQRSAGQKLERKDNGGDYCKANCRWATQREQCRNRRSNVTIEWRGESKILIAWAEELGLPYKLLHSRLRLGWSAERAFTEPPRHR